MSLTSYRLQFVVLSTVLTAPIFACATPASDAIQALAAQDWVARSVSLKDLGITNPVVLDQADNRQVFFLPVPKGVAISDAHIALEGEFIKGEAQPATLRLAVDGLPRVAERINQARGSLPRTLPVDSGQHASGFVDFALDWSSPVSEDFCAPPRATANVLTLSPETRLVYRYSMSALSSLTDVWGSLPAEPSILVAAGALDRASFDSAWRLGVALERSARRAQVRALPQVGDSVQLAGIEVPAALTTVPAFAALAGQQRHTLANPAELGALLLLDAPATRADLAIADSALITQLNAALDALGHQLQGDPEAFGALNQWRQQRASLALEPVPGQQLQLRSLGRQVVVAIAADAGAKAAGVLDAHWRDVLVSQQAEVRAVGEALRNEHGHLRLSSLGGNFGTFDVVSRGEWTATFPLSAVSVNGLIPGELNLDVAAAPGASSTRPVASVIWNNVLLSAAQLDADGHPERLKARIPGYALGVTNTVQVRFQRQPSSPDCAEVPQAYPVNVLPSSYLISADAEPDGTFVGLLPLLANKPQVFVDEAALKAPVASVGKLIRLASAAALSPVNAELVLTTGKADAAPSRPFLALDVPLTGAKPLLGVAELQRLQAQGNQALALDLQGPQGLGTLSVVSANGQSGVLWNSLGNPNMVPKVPFLLSQGNAVVVGEQGPLTWVDTTDPELNLGGTPFHQWRKQLVWALPTLSGVVLLLLLLGVIARRLRLKNKGK
ncbi:membrane protein [Pseudomonas putida]|uniref:Membrane protein n=1 Tax=Pseudomonas putida TaxID=303 RepID=A0AA37RBY0_PSEPU|nr:hypothetical protein [Pseudomonas putida]GLO12855.1 membrane protein [Pseudomonas putida]GLO35965.1 membrane protein [Pseudomonas putida]HDS0962687.1 hypothetical protein [Pseudomonas putida]HDS0989535.1 hypothetical protein [Pseudomonas putida]